MSTPVKRRPYTSDLRRRAADDTRRAILSAARSAFVRSGWHATSVADVAASAGVSVDTLYRSVGRKPALLLAAHDMILAEGDDPVPALERDYVRAVRAQPTARGKLATYAEALGRVLPESVPLLLALRSAGEAEPECRRVFDAVTERRAANMLLLAADLRGTGELRPDWSDEQVADLVWSMNGPEYVGAFLARGVPIERWTTLLAEVWIRTLLVPTVAGSGLPVVDAHRDRGEGRGDRDGKHEHDRHVP